MCCEHHIEATSSIKGQTAKQSTIKTLDSKVNQSLNRRQLYNCVLYIHRFNL